MGKRERRRRREAAALTASSPPVPTAVPNVDTLRRLVKRRDQLGEAITWEIDRLADAGVGWPQIAAVLGVSRQAARQAALRRRNSPRVPRAPRGPWEMDDPSIDVDMDGDLKRVERMNGSWSSGDDVSYR